MTNTEQRFQRELADGEVLFREGEAASSMFVVRSGNIRVTKQVRGGEKTLAVLGPGEFLGEMAIINGEPRSATVSAVGPAVLLEVDVRRFETMLTTQTEIAVRIIKNLAKRLEKADETIAILTQRDVKTRVILGLMREAERSGKPGDQPGSVTLLRDLDEMADNLGLIREELDGVLGRLSRIGVIAFVEGGVHVPVLAKLGDFLSFVEAREG